MENKNNIDPLEAKAASTISPETFNPDIPDTPLKPESFVRQFSATAGPSMWGVWYKIGENTGTGSYEIEYRPVDGTNTTVYGKVRYFHITGVRTELEFTDSTNILTGNAYDSIEVCFKGFPLGCAVVGTISG